MMKKIVLLLVLAIAFNYSLKAGDGSENNPFTVAEAIKKNDQTKAYYVKGFVVGEMDDYSGGNHIYEMAPPFGGTTAILIADNADEIDLSKCLNIQLKSYAEDFTLDWNPEVWRKEVLVCGNLKRYMEMPGIQNISLLDITSPEPLEDETLLWNFFEDMNSKNYTPNSSTNTFAGGTYIGDTGTWNFIGSTWGDTGKDQKFGKAAARIRLTDGPTGDAGHIQMEQDKENGIGTVRFWAGNYEEDTSGGALALYASVDEGSSWEKVSGSILITRKWKEYQFFINKAGNIRLRIAKDETGSKGINVDNIRISDYVEGEVPVSSDATLKSLAVTPGTLTPEFDSKVTSYTVNVDNSVDKITITAQPSHDKATVTGAGENNLNIGENTLIVKVLAEDKITEEEYGIIVYRGEAPVGLDANKMNELFQLNTEEKGVNVMVNKDNLYFNIYDVSGHAVFSGLLNSGWNFIPLNKGIYIIKADIYKDKIIVK